MSVNAALNTEKIPFCLFVFLTVKYRAINYICQRFSIKNNSTVNIHDDLSVKTNTAILYLKKVDDATHYPGILQYNKKI